MSKKYIQALMAMTAASAILVGQDTPTYTPEPEDPKQRERRLKAEKEKRYKDQGMQLFDIDGKQIWALNRKSAERKAKRTNK